MKKILLSLMTFLMVMGATFAATYNAESKVTTIGSKLLTKNSIPSSNIKFEVTAKAVDNSTFATDRTVSISKSDLAYAQNDNETAAVIANELGHIISGHAAKGKLLSSITGDTSTNTTTTVASGFVEDYQNTKAEKEADVIAVNLMANAGYNPLAAIVVLTKHNATYWSAIMGEPANAQRAMNIYDYANYAYPNSTKSGYNCIEYKNFLTYANTVLAKRKENKKLQSKSQKELKKYRKNSVSQITKFKTRGGLSGWDAAYGLLNGN